MTQEMKELIHRLSEQPIKKLKNLDYSNLPYEDRWFRYMDVWQAYGIAKSTGYALAHHQKNLEGIGWQHLPGKELEVNLGFFEFCQDLYFKIWETNQEIYMKLIERGFNQYRLATYLKSRAGGSVMSWVGYMRMGLWASLNFKLFSYKIPSRPILFLTFAGELLLHLEEEGEIEYECETNS